MSITTMIKNRDQKPKAELKAAWRDWFALWAEAKRSVGRAANHEAFKAEVLSYAQEAYGWGRKGAPMSPGTWALLAEETATFASDHADMASRMP